MVLHAEADAGDAPGLLEGRGELACGPGRRAAPREAGRDRPRAWRGHGVSPGRRRQGLRAGGAHPLGAALQAGADHRTGSGLPPGQRVPVGRSDGQDVADPPLRGQHAAWPHVTGVLLDGRAGLGRCEARREGECARAAVRERGGEAGGHGAHSRQHPEEGGTLHGRDQRRQGRPRAKPGGRPPARGLRRRDHGRPAARRGQVGLPGQQGDAGRAGHLPRRWPEPRGPRCRMRHVLLQSRHPAVAGARRHRCLGRRPRGAASRGQSRQADDHLVALCGGRQRDPRRRPGRPEEVGREAGRLPARRRWYVPLRHPGGLAHQEGGALPDAGQGRLLRAVRPRRQAAALRAADCRGLRRQAAGEGRRHGRARREASARHERGEDRHPRRGVGQGGEAGAR